MLPNLDFIKTVLNGVNLKLAEALGIAKNAVLKTEQRLTESEKEIARNNIGAASTDNAAVLTVYALTNTGGDVEIDKTFLEIQEAILDNRQVQLKIATKVYPLVVFGKGYVIRFGDSEVFYEVSTVESKAIRDTYAKERLHWINAGSITLTHTTNAIALGVGTYRDVIAMKVEFNIPADSTQLNDNGAMRVYPSKYSEDSSVEVTLPLSNWKTTPTKNVILFMGDDNGIVSAGAANAQLVPDTRNNTSLTVMDGVILRIDQSRGHWPVGGSASIEVLSLTRK